MPRSKTDRLEVGYLLSFRPFSGEGGEFCWYTWGRREYNRRSGNYCLVLPEGTFLLPESGLTGKLTEGTSFSLTEKELEGEEAVKRCAVDGTRGVVCRCRSRPCRVDDGILCSGMKFLLDRRCLSETSTSCPFLERLREKAFLLGPDFPTPEEIDECREKFGDELTCRGLYQIYIDEHLDARIAPSVLGGVSALSPSKAKDLPSDLPRAGAGGGDRRSGKSRRSG